MKVSPTTTTPIISGFVVSVPESASLDFRHYEGWVLSDLSLSKRSVSLTFSRGDVLCVNNRTLPKDIRDGEIFCQRPDTAKHVLGQKILAISYVFEEKIVGDSSLLQKQCVNLVTPEGNLKIHMICEIQK